MDVLVTGGAGFVGSHVCEALIARGDRVIALDNFDPFYPADVKRSNLSQLHGHEHFTLVEGDLRSPESLDELFRIHTFDVVVHLAAKAGIRASMQEPAAFVASNVEGTVNLLEAMARADCRRLVFGSSSSVYGNNPGRASREDDPLEPLSVYAITKAAGEDLCRVYHGARRFGVLCLRFFTVYGPRQRPEMAIHKFTRRLLDEELIPIFGDGSMARDYTYVGDIVQAVTAATDRIAAEREWGVVNVGSGSPVSLIDLIESLSAIVGVEPILDHRPAPKGDVSRTHADIERARELLGYAPAFDLDTGLKRFATWYRSMAAVGAESDAAAASRT